MGEECNYRAQFTLGQQEYTDIFKKKKQQRLIIKSVQC